MDTNVKINESDISVIIVKNENWNDGVCEHSFRWSNVFV